MTGGGNYGIGHLTGISDESGIDWRVFDTKGRVSTYYRTPYPLQTAVVSSYQYDAAGNVTGFTYPSGRFVAFQRDTQGRVTTITAYPAPGAPSGQTIASAIAYYPFGRVASLTHGNSYVETFTVDSDYRVTGVKVAGPGGNVPIDRAMTWMGETLTTLTDNAVAADSQTFTYTPTHRLATAAGAYGAYAWAYDGVGNRTSEQLSAALSTYAYPTTSNRLAAITPAAGPSRTFTYDPAGAIATDTRGAGPALTFQYDQEGRLAKAFETATPANGGTYAYDARWRLSSRTVTQTAAPTSATVLYVYDQADHIIAELDTNGQTQREYVWLDDTPVAVVDGIAAGTPTFYYVHVDHLNRPIRMTTQTRGRAGRRNIPRSVRRPRSSSTPR